MTKDSITRKFKIATYEGYMIVAFEATAPTDIFIFISKEGSVVGGLCKTLAATISLALQSGVPWETLYARFVDMHFEPSDQVFKSIAHVIADTLKHCTEIRNASYRSDARRQ
jgi:hypothetical protein